MSVEENKALVRRFFEDLNARGRDFRDKSLFDAFENTYLSEDFVHHAYQGDLSREEDGRYYNALFTAYPDINWRIEDIFGEGDRVFLRTWVTRTDTAGFQGMEPTGKRISFMNAGVFRVAEGKFVEAWSFLDRLGVLQQLGVLPPGFERGNK